MVLVYIYSYIYIDLNDWINIPYLEHLGHASNKHMCHMAFVINVEKIQWRMISVQALETSSSYGQWGYHEPWMGWLTGL